MRWKLVTLALALISLCAWDSHAQVRKMGIEECLLTADSVFVGTVVGAQPRWGEGKRLIWTDYTFEVGEVWKGPESSRCVVSVGGGTLEGKTIYLTEVPNFEMGATYLVCAYDNRRLYAEGVVGVEQGLFEEVLETASGRRVLVDARGFLLEIRENGSIRRGAPTEKVGPGTVRALTEAELSARDASRRQQAAAVSVPPPIYRDADGNVLQPAPAPVQDALLHPVGVPVDRSSMRSFALSVIQRGPLCAEPKGGK